MSEVRNNAAAGRYELDIDQQMAVAYYHDQDGTRIFTHTEVPTALRGRGIGSALLRDALADTRRHGMRIVPVCSFVKEYIDRHSN